MTEKGKSFADYRAEGSNWITLANGDYYPDILKSACELYEPVLVTFDRILRGSESSVRLFLEIIAVKPAWMRVQLLRVFKKYVSPSISVEMTKRIRSSGEIVETFGPEFRPINQVQAAFSSRPIPDEAMCALLWEYKDRGKKGYDLTERFFSIVRDMFPDFRIIGPMRAGQDIRMGTIFQDYPNPNRPVDFIIYEPDNNTVLAVGLARYDSDRGGAQEDDRTGGYNDCAREILSFASAHNMNTKVVFLNDGPGLLLGSMWRDYSALEASWPGRVMVATLRMIPDRLTREWLLS